MTNRAERFSFRFIDGNLQEISKFVQESARLYMLHSFSATTYQYLPDSPQDIQVVNQLRRYPSVWPARDPRVDKITLLDIR